MVGTPSSSILSYLIPSIPLLFKALNHRCRLRNSPKIAFPRLFLIFSPSYGNLRRRRSSRRASTHPCISLWPKTEPQPLASELGPENDRAKGVQPYFRGWFSHRPACPDWCGDRILIGLHLALRALLQSFMILREDIDKDFETVIQGSS